MTPAPPAVSLASRLVAWGILPALLACLFGGTWHWHQHRDESLRAWSQAQLSVGWQPLAPSWHRAVGRWPQFQAIVSPQAPHSLVWPAAPPLRPGRELELALRCRSLSQLEGPASLLLAPDWTRWSGQSSLDTLVLTNGPLEPHSVVALARLANLRHLVCRDVMVAPGTLREVARQLQLDSVEFQFCDVPADEWGELRAAPQLARLELIGATLPDEAWGRLQAALPRLRIADD